MTRERLLALTGATILKTLFLTLRLRIEDRSGVLKEDGGSPVIVCFWHNRILGITFAFDRIYPKKRSGVTVLTSPSKDGEILAQLVGAFGMEAVRGSSSRRTRHRHHSRRPARPAILAGPWHHPSGTNHRCPHLASTRLLLAVYPNENMGWFHHPVAIFKGVGHHRRGSGHSRRTDRGGVRRETQISGGSFKTCSGLMERRSPQR